MNTTQVLAQLKQCQDEGGDVNALIRTLYAAQNGGTTSLGLKQWIPTDKPMMEDFNRDNRIVDEKLRELNEKKANLSGANFTGNVTATGSIDAGTIARSRFFSVFRDGEQWAQVYSWQKGVLALGANDTTNTERRLDIYASGVVAPSHDNFFALGEPTHRYKDVYTINAPIVGSDKRIKKDISPLEVSLITKLLMSISAVRYRLIDGSSGRLHYGFIAQDVEAALTEAELTSVDFAGFIKSPALDEDGNKTGDYIYALRLEEFIPILWAHQQDVEQRLQALEAR